jgi:hypothetical protein
MTVAGAAALLVVGVPAQAASPTAVTAKDFPPASAIGASLGHYTAKPTIDTAAHTGTWYVCSNVHSAHGAAYAHAQYQPTGNSPSVVEATARTYPSAAQAANDFDAIAKRLHTCAGTRVEASEAGSTAKWRAVTTVGSVPAVAVDGVPSLYVYTRTSPAKGSSLTTKQVGSTYEVITLSGDSILVTDAVVNPATSLSATQKNAVTSFASDVAGTWTSSTG